MPMGVDQVDPNSWYSVIGDKSPVDACDASMRAIDILLEIAAVRPSSPQKTHESASEKPASQPSNSANETPDSVERAPFIASPLQKAILEKLDRTALRSRPLAKILSIDQPKLYKPNGIKELMELGKVKTHTRIGYYRPDAPPQEHAEILKMP